MGETVRDRTTLVAEMASNHGGDWHLAKKMIDAAANAGADIVKFQLYDTKDLREDDPQYEWLTHAQIPDVGTLMNLAARAKARDLGFTVSVFSIAAAEMAASAGLTIVKLGSGEVRRDRLRLRCRDLFPVVWESKGLEHGTMPKRSEHQHVNLTPFYGVSQYPTPYLRGYSTLMQCDKRGVWGWSDHGEDLEVAKEAICYGASFVERHFNFANMRHRGGRPFSDWDTTPEQFRTLRLHAEECAWVGTAQWKLAQDRYIGRWRDA